MGEVHKFLVDAATCSEWSLLLRCAFRSLLTKQLTRTSSFYSRSMMFSHLTVDAVFIRVRECMLSTEATFGLVNARGNTAASEKGTCM